MLVSTCKEEPLDLRLPLDRKRVQQTRVKMELPLGSKLVRRARASMPLPWDISQDQLPRARIQLRLDIRPARHPRVIRLFTASRLVIDQVIRTKDHFPSPLVIRVVSIVRVERLVMQLLLDNWLVLEFKDSIV